MKYENLSFRTVPAYPGFFVAMPVYDKNDICVDFHDSPVVAWNVVVFSDAISALEGKAQAIPVIAEEYLTELYCIKMPDGSYDLPDDYYNLTKIDAINLINEIRNKK